MEHSKIYSGNNDEMTHHFETWLLKLTADEFIGYINSQNDEINEKNK